MCYTAALVTVLTHHAICIRLCSRGYCTMRGKKHAMHATGLQQDQQVQGRLMATAEFSFIFCVSLLFSTATWQQVASNTKIGTWKGFHLATANRDVDQNQNDFDKVSAHSVHTDKRPLPSMPWLYDWLKSTCFQDGVLLPLTRGLSSTKRSPWTCVLSLVMIILTESEPGMFQRLESTCTTCTIHPVGTVSATSVWKQITMGRCALRKSQKSVQNYANQHGTLCASNHLFRLMFGVFYGSKIRNHIVDAASMRSLF